jgi:hypothetical protein
VPIVLRRAHLALVAVLLTALLVNPSGPAPFGAAPVRAAGPTVTNTNDSGAGSLRQAILDATPGDTIDFQPGLAGKIALTSGLVITKTLTIAGPGAGTLAVDGGGGTLIFDIRASTAITVSGLTLQHGFGGTGGAIQVASASLTLKDSTVMSSTAALGGGAIYADDLPGAPFTVNLINSTLRGNQADGSGIFGGGGIAARNMSNPLLPDRINLVNSTLSGNTAPVGGGGGIFAFSAFAPTPTGLEVDLTGSAFFTNTATNGGGIYVFGATVSAANSTLSANAAGNGGGLSVVFSQVVTLTNSTLSGNMGGSGSSIRNFSGLVNLKNTIVDRGVGNISPGNICNGAISSLGNNLSSDGSCGLGAAGDLPNRDPLLGPLQLNAPGGTATHALLPGSPALGAADNAACAAAPVNGVDQRGVARPQGTRCDIGAYEARKGTVVNSLLDPGPPECAITCTLRAAVGLAENGDTVTFAPGLSGTIALSGGTPQPPLLTRALAIAGPGAKVLAVDGGNAARILDIQAGSAFTITGLTLQRGNAGTGNGGAVRVTSASLTLSNTAILSSTAALGGGLYADSGAAAGIAGVTLAGNSATNGGGLYADTGAIINLTNSTLSDNTASSLGGGLAAYGNATFNLAFDTVAGNAAFGGGGIRNVTGIVNLKDTIVAGNASGNDCGGGVTSLGHNLASDTTCALDQPGDLPKTDARLGPLQDNGGQTLTRAILPYSPAIDAGGSAGCPATDQRGISRPQAKACDIGAYEFVPPTLTLSPASLALAAGGSGVVTATLSLPQATDTALSVSSSNGLVASAPLTVTIPMNQTSATFQVTGNSQGGPVTITAALPAGLGGGTASVVANVSGTRLFLTFIRK